ncbi:protein SINE1-like [Typha latifolia]|uniref:protein SINE1-like n=1 Tax=Typha latifolia TaxID=4733 RepID=UPI003C2BFE33
MGENIGLLLRKELENMGRDAESCKAAMKSLKSYIEDLDSNTLPLFLNFLFGTKESSSTLEECTISLLEVLARVHGRNIVPHIDSMMSEITATMYSSEVSPSLNQSCCKVVAAIARYGINPLALDSEKKRIIRSLSRPLADCLMVMQENTASGAAFCLKALVESENWQYASDELVNEVCVKVAGALEEKHTQTNSHLGLVSALTRKNPMLVEPYARSLVRSGLQILISGINESNSQRQLSAIQMIKILMECIDSRSISSEIVNIVDVLENCQNNQMPFVTAAVLETLETAQVIAEGKRYQLEISSPFTGSNFDDRCHRRTSWSAIDSASFSATRSSEFPSRELHTSDSFVNHGSLADSPSSMQLSPCSNRFSRQGNLRQLNKDIDALVSNNGFLLTASSGCHDSVVPLELIKPHNEHPGKDAHESITYMTNRVTSPKPQRSRSQITVGDVKMCSTPRKCLCYHQNSAENPVCWNHERMCGRMSLSPALSQVRRGSAMALSGDHLSQDHSHDFRGGTSANLKQLNEHQHVQEAHLNTEDMASSAGNLLADGACKGSCRFSYKDSNIQIMNTEGVGCRIAAPSFIFCLCALLIAIILSSLWIGEDRTLHVVPT